MLDRFKERKVGLTVESMYDPNVVNHAAVVLKDLIAERGHQFATVTPELRRIPPASLEVGFSWSTKALGVKVGMTTIVGNEAFTQRQCSSGRCRSQAARHSLFYLSRGIFFQNLRCFEA